MQDLSFASFHESIQQQGTVVVTFFSHRCQPCKELHPQLEDLENTLLSREDGHEPIHFFTVDTDTQTYLAGTENISSLPTIKIYRNGKQQETLIGNAITQLPAILEV